MILPIGNWGIVNRQRERHLRKTKEPLYWQIRKLSYRKLMCSCSRTIGMNYKLNIAEKTRLALILWFVSFLLEGSPMSLVYEKWNIVFLKLKCKGMSSMSNSVTKSSQNLWSLLFLVPFFRCCLENINWPGSSYQSNLKHNILFTLSSFTIGLVLLVKILLCILVLMLDLW